MFKNGRSRVRLMRDKIINDPTLSSRQKNSQKEKLMIEVFRQQDNINKIIKDVLVENFPNENLDEEDEHSVHSALDQSPTKD